MFSGIGGFELGVQSAYENQGLERDRQTDIRLPRRQETKHCPGNESSQTQRPDGFSLNGSYPECVGYSEINKYAIQVYEKHFKHTNYGDATKINPAELPDFDLLVGGFPCQAFSVAGKRLGFSDTRGTLFFDIARIIKHKRPRHLVLENVKGLLSHDFGKTFQTILGVLADLGYFVEWQVLNSKDFGVPQNRERVFIIGHLGRQPTRKVFPILGSNPKGLEELTNNAQQGYRVYGENGIAPTQASQAGGVGAKTGLVAPTIRATEYKHGDNQTVVAVLTPDRPEKRQNGRRFKEDGEPSFTLTGQDKHGVMVNTRIRRLTPVECARLQGFPDDWCSELSDTQQYKCYGNAVTTNVVRAIMERLY